MSTPPFILNQDRTMEPSMIGETILFEGYRVRGTRITRIDIAGIVSGYETSFKEIDVSHWGDYEWSQFKDKPDIGRLREVELTTIFFTDGESVIIEAEDVVRVYLQPTKGN